jgi:hypothetical protein
MPGTSFHLRHDAEEDRVLVLIDTNDANQYGMALTRRLAKLLLGSLADLEVKRRGQSGTADPARREAVLSFEHQHAVSQSLSSGETRRNEPARPLVAAPRLVREIKLTPNASGGVALALDDKANAMTIQLDPQRLHSFMAALLEVAAGAGWDLPRIATWLEGAKAPPATDTIVH